jgi:dTDP-4-dehydrorhamnose 3,5-epimerase-like enzyme
MQNKVKYDRKTGKIFKDTRGWLKKIIDGNFSSCIEVYSKKGTIRANHYHRKDKHFIYVISGKILYFYKDRKKNAKVQIKKMNKGDLFYTPAMQEHMAYFLKPTHFLAFSTRKRTQFDYEKDLIRVNMEKYLDVKKSILKNIK